MSDTSNPSVEDYLEAIYGLDEEGIPVIQARLVERLGHSPQSVSEMVHRLTDGGYLAMSGRGVALTDKGQSTAYSVVRKHRLAERFLVDILGLPWHKAHREAGRWEHVMSDEVEDRFIKLLGNPTTCPHGSPIPGTKVSQEKQIPLNEVPTGERVHLARITEQVETDWEALVYLSEHGIIPGQDATILAKAPDGTLTLELTTDGEPRTVALGAALSHKVFVRAVSPVKAT